MTGARAAGTFVRRNAISLLALFFAMTGTAIAARHYLITSTRQITPGVLRQLHGRAGRNGASRGLSERQVSPVTLASPSGLQPVLTIANVAAGYYIVTASVELEATVEAVNVRCEVASFTNGVRSPFGSSGESSAYLAPATPQEEASTSVTGGLVLRARGSIKLLCNTFGTPGVRAHDAAVTAVQVQQIR